MVEKIFEIDNKKRPLLNVKIPLRVDISISCSKNQIHRLNVYVLNNKVDTGSSSKKSSIIREIIYEKLKVKDEREFQRLFKDEMDMVKQKIYDISGVTADKSFSNIIIEELDKKMEIIENEE